LMQGCHSIAILGVHFRAFGQEPDDYIGAKHVYRIMQSGKTMRFQLLKRGWGCRRPLRKMKNPVRIGA
jgi:hypothetical protein